LKKIKPHPYAFHSAFRVFFFEPLFPIVESWSKHHHEFLRWVMSLLISRCSDKSLEAFWKLWTSIQQFYTLFTLITKFFSSFLRSTFTISVSSKIFTFTSTPSRSIWVAFSNNSTLKCIISKSTQFRNCLLFKKPQKCYTYITRLFNLHQYFFQQFFEISLNETITERLHVYPKIKLFQLSHFFTQKIFHFTRRYCKKPFWFFFPWLNKML